MDVADCQRRMNQYWCRESRVSGGGGDVCRDLFLGDGEDARQNPSILVGWAADVSVEENYRCCCSNFDIMVTAASSCDF